MTEQGKEAEQYAIGSILTDDSKVVQLIELPEEYFYRSEHKAIHRAVSELFSQSIPVDLFSISEQLERTQAALGVDWMAYLSELAENHPSSAHFESYAGVLADYAKRREVSSAIQNVGMQLENGADVGDIVDYMQDAVVGLASKTMTGGLTQWKDVLGIAMDRIQQRQTNPGKLSGQATGYADLDRKLDGFEDGKVYVVAGRTSMGKAQPLTSKILMADGNFKKLGDISTGDSVASVDGSESIVDGVYPQGVRPVYTITLSDGRTVEADADHLWSVNSCRWAGSKILKTTEVAEKLSKKRYKNRIKLATHDGRFGKDPDLGVSPWLIGMLLGDGCLTRSGVCFSNPEKYIENRAGNESGLEVRSAGNGVDKRFYSGKNNPYPLRRSLESIGMMNCKAHEKIIPDPVFRASRFYRGSVLAGILESDGWIEKFGSVQFSSSSELLADGVVDLVRSLGGSAYKKKKTRFFTYKGGRRDGRNAFCISIALDSLAEFIRSPRLLANFKARNRNDSPTIKSVDFDRYDETQCISVTHEEHLYITDNYVVTHNTAFTLQLLYLLAQSQPWAVFSLEMTDASIGMRALSNASNLFTSKLKANPEPMNDGDVAAYAAGISRAKSYNIHVDTTPNLAVAQIRARLKVQVLKHGPVGGIVIDHIGLIKNPKGMSRTEGMSAIAHELQSLAKEFNCPLIELVQINRGSEHEKDRRPSLHQLKQSGAIEEDADVVMLLYRDEYYYSDTEQPGVTEVQIAKNRDGETGVIGFQSSMATGRYAEIGEMDPPKKSNKVKGADL